MHQFRLILDTPESVKKRLAAINNTLHRLFKGLNINAGHPFIYLAGFSAYESYQEQILDTLTKIALAARPFQLHLTKYNVLSTDEVYIEVKEVDPIRELIHQIAQIKQVQELKLNQLPRITLIKDLYAWQYEKSWPYFEKRRFQSRFVLGSMLLLKKSAGFRSWKIEKRFYFENQLVR